eukprot:jgi/Mesvir1/4363/Mv02443-RA.1
MENPSLSSTRKARSLSPRRDRAGASKPANADVISKAQELLAERSRRASSGNGGGSSSASSRKDIAPGALAYVKLVEGERQSGGPAATVSSTTRGSLLPGPSRVEQGGPAPLDTATGRMQDGSSQPASAREKGAILARAQQFFAAKKHRPMEAAMNQRHRAGVAATRP